MTIDYDSDVQNWNGAMTEEEILKDVIFDDDDHLDKEKEKST